MGALGERGEHGTATSARRGISAECRACSRVEPGDEADDPVLPLHDLARIDQRLPDHANQVQLEQLTALARRHPKKLAKLVAVVRELVA
jgi:hypothetical protein